MRKDLEFLNELRNLIETHEPSTTNLFTSHIVQLKTPYRMARLSLRRRMRAELDGSKNKNKNDEVIEENQDSINADIGGDGR